MIEFWDTNPDPPASKLEQSVTQLIVPRTGSICTYCPIIVIGRALSFWFIPLVTGSL